MSNPTVDIPVSPPQDQRVDDVLEIVRRVLDKPRLTADDEVMEHGGTSLSILRILTETRQTLQLNVNPRDLNGAVTARSLARAAR